MPRLGILLGAVAIALGVGSAVGWAQAPAGRSDQPVGKVLDITGKVLDIVGLDIPGPHVTGKSGLLQSLFRPAKIWLNPDKPSALPGQSITIKVLLGYSRDAPTVAEHDVHIDFDVNGAEVDPKAVTIPRGSSSVAAAVRLQEPGRIEVRASSPGLEEGQQRLYSCGSGAIKMIEFDTTRQSEAADGTEIPFSVVLTDNKGHVVTDNKRNYIAFNPQGVGKLQSSGGLVPENQCTRDNNISSSEPGTATIEARLGNLSEKREFLFILPLSIPLFLLVLGGGVAGAFVRAGLTWQRSRRWAPRRWIAFLSCGALTGLCVFLAYYYGLLKFAPSLVRGEGVGVLLGMIGGYLGQAAMDRIAGQIFPLAKQ